MKKFACLGVILIILVACVKSNDSKSSLKTYTNHQCNFSFQYPESIGDDDIIYDDTSSEQDVVNDLEDPANPLGDPDPILCRIVLLATKSNKAVEILAIKPALADQAGIRNYTVSQHDLYESLGNLESQTEVSTSNSYVNIGGQQAVKYVSYLRYLKPNNSGYTGISWYNVNYFFEKDDFVYKMKSHRPNPSDRDMENLIETVVHSFSFLK